MARIDTVNTKRLHLTEKISDQSNINSDDSISLYMNEMDRVPLLTREEEVQLAKLVEDGSSARQRMLDVIDNPKEIEALKETIETGKNAREHLIKANIRLVVNIAKKYRRYSASFLDLIQAGNIGLIRAVDKFDYKRGNRFSTYATWWIRRSVLRHLNQRERTIRLPNYLSTRIRKILAARKELTAKLSRTPTMKEISENVDMSPEDVQKLLGYAKRTVSLDQPVGEDGDTDLQSYIENKNAPNPFTEVKQSLLVDDLISAMDDLTEREASILKLRFGLAGERKRTLKELGVIFGITRERIRQIQKGALRKLRHPIYRSRLRDYIQ
jgi:RNA polymerase primary sigma factor